MEQNRPAKTYSWFNGIKNIFWVLVILQFAPMMIINFKKTIQEAIAPQPKIGFLSINGMIADSSFFLKNIKKFSKADDVKGLLIKIDSGGGYPGSGQMIFSELNRFKQKKPIVVIVENVCASAAYLIACAANKIVAPSASMIGSIGSFMQVPDAKGLMNDWKVDMHHIASGKYKAAGSPFRALTDEEQKYLQEVCDDSYHQFIHDVVQSRKLDIQEAEQWAQGRVMMASKALQFNLIDQLGSYNDALDELKKLANIQGRVKLLRVKQPGGIMSLLAGSDDLDVEAPSFAQKVACFLSETWSSFCSHQMMNNQVIHRT